MPNFDGGWINNILEVIWWLFSGVGAVLITAGATYKIITKFKITDKSKTIDKSKRMDRSKNNIDNSKKEKKTTFFSKNITNITNNNNYSDKVIGLSMSETKRSTDS